MSNRPRWGKLRVLGALATVALLVLVTAMPGQAHRLGGKRPGTSYSYFTNLNGYTGYADPIASAGSAWTTRTVFTVAVGTPQSAPVTVNVADYNDPIVVDWAGYGEPGPDHTSGTYTYGSVRVNAGWLNTRHWNCPTPGGADCAYDADTNTKRQCVVSHEMGHVIGLAHTGTNVNYQAIMYDLHGAKCHAWGIVGAKDHDITDVDSIY